MNKLSNPIIYELDYNKDALDKFQNDNLLPLNENESKLLKNYPTVYIINEKNQTKYSVYVGETTDITRRTIQHLIDDPKHREDWQRLSQSKDAKMFIIGHDHFNKSLTLDIENQLMLYLSSVDKIKTIYNRRTNQQNQYYTSGDMQDIFSKIWRQLRKKDPDLFPLERIIQDSAIFKASPFHKLSNEQVRTKNFIYQRVLEALKTDLQGQLIFVNGEAGSGKTVLMSSLFYDLIQLSKEDDDTLLNDLSVYLLVNHLEQLTVYKDIARKLDILGDKKDPRVTKPSSFINKHSNEESIDVVIVDEAHLLLTQGNQGYQGKNQLYDLLERARVVIAVFDQNQILRTDQYWEYNELSKIQMKAKNQGNFLYLHNQMRIRSDKYTLNWLRSFIDHSEILPIPKDSKGYDIQIMSSPSQLHQAIIDKSQNIDQGLSRLVATFDWEYKDKRRPEDEDYWYVKIGDWKLPWNLQLEKTSGVKHNNLSWAERPNTINEIGSTYTIQGFDLNYVGVIIGPSVKYRDGKVIFDPSASENKKAVRNRTLKNGKKQKFGEELLKNELNVLLTRGVHGLYIYAVDPELQAALMKAKKGE